MSGQMFAEPVAYYAANETDVDRLRQRLAEAEQRAARATGDYTTRTRAEQDAVILRRELKGAELQRRVNQRAVNQHAVHLAQAIAAGRYLPPVPYFARQESQRLDHLPCAAAMNGRGEEPTSFAALSRFVEEARKAGMLKSGG